MVGVIEHLGVQHVGMAFDDLEKARRFYEEVLGLLPLARPASSSVPGLWYDLGNGQMVHLAQRQEDPRIPVQHFALSVSDVEAVVAELERRGAAVERRTYVPGYGRQAFVRDPSGNVVEFNQLDREPLGCEVPTRDGVRPGGDARPGPEPQR